MCLLFNQTKKNKYFKKTNLKKLKVNQFYRGLARTLGLNDLLTLQKDKKLRKLYNLLKNRQLAEEKTKKFKAVTALRKSGNYQSFRLLKTRLPVRGQRTHTNAKTRKRTRGF